MLGSYNQWDLKPGIKEKKKKLAGSALGEPGG